MYSHHPLLIQVGELIDSTSHYARLDHPVKQHRPDEGEILFCTPHQFANGQIMSLGTDAPSAMSFDLDYHRSLPPVRGQGGSLWSHWINVKPELLVKPGPVAQRIQLRNFQIVQFIRPHVGLR